MNTIVEKEISLCPYCHIQGCFDNITTQHRQVCPEYPVGCPRKCSESDEPIKRKNLQDHKKICPLEPIMCNLCNEALIRQKIKAHKSNPLPQTISLLSSLQTRQVHTMH